MIFYPVHILSTIFIFILITGEGPWELKLVSFWWVKCEGICSLGGYSAQAGIFDFYGTSGKKCLSCWQIPER